MNRQSNAARHLRRPTGRRARPFMLVSRGPDGRVRTERFKTAADYRSRLLTLTSGEGRVSLDEIIELLDA